jgi:HrpA-like RNA helicase
MTESISQSSAKQRAGRAGREVRSLSMSHRSFPLRQALLTLSAR